MSSSSSSATTRRRILAGIGGSILSLPIVGEIYSRLGPSDAATIAARIFHDNGEDGDDDDTTTNTRYRAPFSDNAGVAWDKIEDVTIVFHGAAGPDQYTDELMTNLAKANHRRPPRSKSKSTYYQTMIDWSDLSSNILQASFNGQRLGRETASRLLARCPNLKTLHLIGISVGAFAADECCKSIKKSVHGVASESSPNTDNYDENDNNDVYIQLTLLDPFQQRGVLGTGYGNANFGGMADYARQYLNTDDPVPSTNAPLDKCVCYDITELRPEEIFGHDWPVIYYARSGSDNLGIVPVEERTDVGSVIYVEK